MAFESLFGYPQTTQQLPTRTPQQIALQNQLGQIGLNKVQQNLDFGPIESLARQNFQTKTLPTIAERFTSMGSGPNSSAFRHQFASAGRDLESNLAALRLQHGLAQQNLGQNLLPQALSPNFENLIYPQSNGAVGGLASGLASGVGAGLGAYGLSQALGGLGTASASSAAPASASALGGAGGAAASGGLAGLLGGLGATASGLATPAAAVGIPLLLAYLAYRYSQNQ